MAGALRGAPPRADRRPLTGSPGGRRCARLAARQRDVEGRARAVHRFAADRPAKRLHAVPDNGEAETVAGVAQFLVAMSVRAEEALEDRWQIARGNAEA